MVLRRYFPLLYDIPMVCILVAEQKEGMARTVLKNMMKVYPEDTSALLAKLWVLEPGEQPPRATRTLTAFFKSKDAIDFFTSALPFLTEFSGQR